MAHAIVEGARALRREKPVLTVFMQSRGVPEELRGTDLRIPSYAFPENAALALARAVRYGEWLRRPEALEPPLRLEDVRRDEAAAIVAAALGRGEEWLPARETRALLACYGLPVLEQRVAATAQAAGTAAREFGGKVALKAMAPGLIHKTEAGAVRLSLEPEQVPAAAGEMETRLRAAGHEPAGFLVQPMAPPGVEMIVGVAHDPHFGPVVACGAGGVLAELLRDVAVRLTPLAPPDAAQMLQELKSYALLAGFRGGPAHDTAALEAAILRVAAMVEELPQIAELDCNPIILHERGATIVDARIRVAAAEPAPPPGAR